MIGGRPFYRAHDLPECGARLDDGTRCPRAPEPGSTLRLCIDHEAATHTGMLAVPADVEREAIVAEKPRRLIVWTAHISTRHPDRFNITRGSGGPAADPFAPSWPLLREAKRLLAANPAEGWDWYQPRYVAEMRVSYAIFPEAWAALLARGRVVATCYCVDATRCHRSLLACILGKLGADVRGELGRGRPAEEPRRDRA